MSTTYGRVRSHRSTRTGAEHFKMQRLTAMANVILVIWFLFAAIGMAGSDYYDWLAFFHSPWNATLMIALIISSFWHSRLGVQVVVEDYVHSEGTKILALAGLTILWALLALACVVSVLMLAVAGV